MGLDDGVVTEGGGPVTPADGGDSSSDVNWSDMALGMDSDDESEGSTIEGDVEVLGESENSADGTPAAPVAPPAAAPTQEAGTPPATVVAPEATQAVTPATPPVAPSAPSQEPPAQPSVTYAEWRGKQVDALAKHYSFDEETSAQLLTEPELVIPKLAAQLHMEVVEHVMRSVQQAIPQWMQGYQSATIREKSAEDVFYGANPDLRDPAYTNAIFQMGAAYRALNPNAPAEEAVKVIGNMVRSAMGVAPAQPNSGVVQTPVAQPSAPSVPFAPARGGGGGAAPSPTSNNPWATLAEEFLTE